MSTNAREFLDQIAAILRAKGRKVEISETKESYGTFVWLSAIAPAWYEHTLTLSASYSTTTKRWTLGELTIDHGKIGVRKTRSDIRISAEVYA